MTTTDRSTDEALASFSWNTLTPERANELCRHARQTPGLAHSEADGGFYLAARYEDVVSIMDDPATFSSAPSVLRPMSDKPPFTALEQDPPQHGAWRELYRELVNPRTSKRMAPQVLVDVNRHIDSFIESGRCDLIHDLAEHVPVETICRAAGIDDFDLAARIRVTAQAALDASGRDPAGFPGKLQEFADLVMPLVDERRVEPRQDFMTRLLTAQPDGEPMKDHEIVSMMFGLLAAGHHSTTSATASLLADVLSRPDVRRRLIEDPGLIPTAVEESLRRDAPFYGFFRRVTRPVEVAGTQLQTDDSICMGWNSANQDAAQFPDPDEFDLDRSNNKHVAFGYGIHTCVGAPLARIEMQITLQQVLTRMPDIELTGPVPEKFFGGAGTTYLPSLPARFTPGLVLAAATV